MVFPLLDAYPAEFVDFFRCSGLNNRWLHVSLDNVVGEVSRRRLEVHLMAKADDSLVRSRFSDSRQSRAEGSAKMRVFWNSLICALRCAANKCI